MADKPVIGVIEWPDGGGDRVATDALDTAAGRGGPAVEDMLLVRGGGSVGAAETAVRGAGRFRVVTMSSGRSYGEAYPPLDLSTKLWAELGMVGREGCCSYATF